MAHDSHGRTVRPRCRAACKRQRHHVLVSNQLHFAGLEKTARRHSRGGNSSNFGSISSSLIPASQPYAASRRRLGLPEQLTQVEEMLLGRAPLGELGLLPLGDEFVGRHGTSYIGLIGFL